VRVVLDASVAVKWVMRDPRTGPNLDKALGLLRAIRAHKIEVVEPPHWTLEILAVIARMRPRRVDFVLGMLGALPFSETSGLSCHRRAAEIAIGLNHHLFDTLYHAVALEEGATLVTADEAYLSKARGLGGIVSLADFSTP
jgi:predicted nucleic acid-binding protein